MYIHGLKDRVPKNGLTAPFCALLLFSISPATQAISTGYTKIQPPSSKALTLISLAPELKPIQAAPQRAIKTVTPLPVNKPKPEPVKPAPEKPSSKAEQTAEQRKQAWLKIQFAPGSAWLHPKYDKAIGNIAKQLATLESNSPLKAIIEGSVGTGVSDEIARKLSAARAEVLKKAILAKNQSLASRLEVRALGVAGDYKNGVIEVNETSQGATLRLSH